MIWTLATTETTLTVESSTHRNITREPLAQLLLETHKNSIKKVKSQCRFQAEVKGQSRF